eukprot:TRINITY_DN10430_c0_g1_i2.p1 TRINITY_DN10430_c0_g1~~TRINITY_DN10430_c0_g1_i2.p1  ORF type:complete len:242 (-),score=23.84 TRINITY_DN10430_c0_g1_i2:201-848(-)
MRPLRDGDIINIDVTVWLDGYHGDTSRTFFVGTPSNTAKQLVKATKEALDAGISVCKPGTDFREIGKAIQGYVNGTNFKVNKDFIGHGIGQNFHPQPWVFHFRNNERQGKMQVGQTFTIEPIVHEGRNINCSYWSDQWTAVSKDGKWSAQFEHTILVTEDGHEILTEYENLQACMLPPCRAQSRQMSQIAMVLSRLPVARSFEASSNATAATELL